MKALTIRPARPDELDTVADLWQHAARWLASRGIDQWQYPPRREAITASIDAGNECWLVEQGPDLVGTITLDRRADPQFWRATDDPETALYAHRMVVRREFAGASIGAALLDWASTRAATEGKKWLRLDAWRTNRDLHRYYESQGFELVRVVENPRRRSGALFQRPAGVVLGTGPRLKEIQQLPPAPHEPSGRLVERHDDATAAMIRLTSEDVP